MTAKIGLITLAIISAIAAEVFAGSNLYTPIRSTETYLMDNDGVVVHSWSSAMRIDNHARCDGVTETRRRTVHRHGRSPGHEEGAAPWVARYSADPPRHPGGRRGS